MVSVTKKVFGRREQLLSKEAAADPVSFSKQSLNSTARGDTATKRDSTDFTKAPKKAVEEKRYGGGAGGSTSNKVTSLRRLTSSNMVKLQSTLSTQ